jgi:hypothetical protein
LLTALAGCAEAEQMNDQTLDLLTPRHPSMVVWSR